MGHHHFENLLDLVSGVVAGVAVIILFPEAPWDLEPDLFTDVRNDPCSWVSQVRGMLKCHWLFLHFRNSTTALKPPFSPHESPAFSIKQDFFHSTRHLICFFPATQHSPPLPPTSPFLNHLSHQYNLLHLNRPTSHLWAPAASALNEWDCNN